MTDHPTGQAVPDKGAASPRLREAAADLRVALDRYDWWQGDTTRTAVLDAARELCDALDELTGLGVARREL